MRYVYLDVRQRRIRKHTLLLYFILIIAPIYSILAVLIGNISIGIVVAISLFTVAYRKTITYIAVGSRRISINQLEVSNLYKAKCRIVSGIDSNTEYDRKERIKHGRGYIYKPTVMFIAKDEFEAESYKSRDKGYGGWILEIVKKKQIPYGEIHIDYNNKICYINSTDLKKMKTYRINITS